MEGKVTTKILVVGLLEPVCLPEAGLAGIQGDELLPTGHKGVELVGLLEEVGLLSKPMLSSHCHRILECLGLALNKFPQLTWNWKR